MSRKWLINLSEELDAINAALDNGKNGLKKVLFSVSFFHVFQTIRETLKYVKFKLIPNQDLFHAHSNIRNSESGICQIRIQEIHQI